MIFPVRLRIIVHRTEIDKNMEILNFSVVILERLFL